MKAKKFLSLVIAYAMALACTNVMVSAETDTGDVAKIGETTYETLAGAFENAKQGDTITLLADVIVTEQIKVADNSLLSDLTIDGGNHTISAGNLTENQSVLYLGDSKTSVWCTGVKIKDLTIDVEYARFGIFFCGGTSSDLTNVTVKGTYHYYGINLFGTHGATMSNCDIVSMFTNGSSLYPLTLTNTKVGTLIANTSDITDSGKITIGEGSTVDKLYLADGRTDLIASGIEKATTVINSDAETDDAGLMMDASWYNDTDTSFTISDKADLYGFANLVNSGITFAGKTVTLAADIDLNNEEWTPIGADGKTFSGKFNGGNHTVSNVYVSEKTYKNVGFFGYMSGSGALIENLTLCNVDITGTQSGVAAVVGLAYTGSKIKNVSVIGKIAVSGGWYVGGINGGMSYVGYENCTVDGSNSEGFESYIKATYPGNYTNYVGGICGLTGEGGGGIDSCTVKNIKLIASEGVGVGGICGVMQYDYSITNCAVENVQLIHQSNTDGDAWTGTIAGKDYSKTYDKNGNQIGASIIINNEVSNVTATVNGEAVTDIFWMGHDHTGTYPPYDEYEPQAIIGVDVTYDENGKINGGTIILVGNNEVVKATAEEMLAETFVLGEIQEDGSYSVVTSIPELPTATVTEIENKDLTFALNFKADEVNDEQLSYYDDWFADFVLTVNKDITFNANGDADGYLSGQYDAWSENWVNVPFEDVTLKAGESIKIMEYAASLMGESGLKLKYSDVYSFVKDFDCGVFLEPEFIAENPDLEITLELKMFNPEDESISYVIGETYEFTAPKDDWNTPEIGVFTKVYRAYDYAPIISYPDNKINYRVGLYAAADSADYSEYGFAVSVDGGTPVYIPATKYGYGINLTVAGNTVELTSDLLTPDEAEANKCVFGQVITFPEEYDNKSFEYRPYVKTVDGAYKMGEKKTVSDIYTK